MSDPVLERHGDAFAWWAEVGDGAPTSSLTGTGAVARLEQRFTELSGQRCAFTTGSGTGALVAALVAAGTTPGCDVIVAAYDWPAATAATLLLGARPHFVDVDSTGTIDPAGVHAALTVVPRPTAVVATHLLGQLADVPALMEIAASFGVAVVEDCAQSLGAELHGRPAGGIGDFGCYSLGPGKTVDAGEGGVVVVSGRRRIEALQRAVLHPLRQHLAGLDEPSPWAAVGRVHPAAAVLGCYELEDLPARLAVRRAQVTEVLRVLAGCDGIELPVVRAGSNPTWHRLAVLTADLDHTLTQLDELGLAAGRGPLERPCGLLRGVLPPRSMARFDRSIVVDLPPWPARDRRT